MKLVTASKKIWTSRTNRQNITTQKAAILKLNVFKTKNLPLLAKINRQNA